MKKEKWDPAIRVYISGPITGTKNYAMRFAEAEARLEKMGFSVFNPARVNAELPENLEHEEYMEMSMAMLGMCDGIYMLNGWRDSEGHAGNTDTPWARGSGYGVSQKKKQRKGKI